MQKIIVYASLFIPFPSPIFRWNSLCYSLFFSSVSSFAESSSFSRSGLTFRRGSGYTIYGNVTYPLFSFSCIHGSPHFESRREVQKKNTFFRYRYRSCGILYRGHDYVYLLSYYSHYRQESYQFDVFQFPFHQSFFFGRVLSLFLVLWRLSSPLPFFPFFSLSLSLSHCIPLSRSTSMGRK